ncbi:MAG: Tex family protein [Muribaculaceae bacterium]|nr:Tex family protein [Muribaculaceae bacterium]
MDRQTIDRQIAESLNISYKQVENTIKLLDDGCTIPFISRYRKEATGNLDEVVIQNIYEKNEEIKILLKRKEFIISTLAEQGNLSEELKSRIDNCLSQSLLEDIYLPFKPKRRTRAEIARLNGLEPLAKIIMSQHNDDITYRARKFINETISDCDLAISGALDIIAEWISENEIVRNNIRNLYKRYAVISSNVIKGKEDEAEKYNNYFNYNEPLQRISSYRLLAMRRGEKDGLLKVNISIDNDIAIDNIKRIVVKGDSESAHFVSIAASDSFKRLIKPSIETEFANLSKEKADLEAIDTFKQNLRQLLFVAPLGNKRILGIDPGFRTGCKIVCIDENGTFLHNDTIYPNAPQNDTKIAAKKISQLIESYRIDAIAIGNGTASRETEKFISTIRFGKQVQVFIVSENGASIYSASKVAREEFPDKDVTVRGAVSIARRLLDPLSELVKIDPKSIGVGQYQHDVDQTKLKSALNFTVESCVNQVGVNLNTASKYLLTYVSGLGEQLAQNIVEYRVKNGGYSSRKDLLNVPRMGEKAFQQSAGFLRIPDSLNPLDNSAVHPESYKIVEQMAKDSKCSVSDLISDSSIRNTINLSKYVCNDIGLPTLEDIIKELEKPGRDPRSKAEILEFDENVKSISDVKVGMILNGIVTNITQFGAFVDFGIKENGLLHISEITDKFIKSPSEILKLHQHIKVKVILVDTDRRRISLSLKGI